MREKVYMCELGEGRREKESSSRLSLLTTEPDMRLDLTTMRDHDLS